VCLDCCNYFHDSTSNSAATIFAAVFYVKICCFLLQYADSTFILGKKLEFSVVLPTPSP